MNQLKVIKTKNAMDELFKIIFHLRIFSDRLKMQPHSHWHLLLLLILHHVIKTHLLIIIQPLLNLKKASSVGHRVVSVLGIIKKLISANVIADCL